MDLNIIKPHQCFLERLSSVLSRLSQDLFSDPSPHGGGITFVSLLNSLYSSEYNKVLWKLKLYIYGLVNHLDSNDAKHASRFQNRSSRYFLTFVNWI